MHRFILAWIIIAITAPALVHAQSGTPRILTRSEWGADESFLINAPPSKEQDSNDTRTSDPASGPVTPSERMKQCQTDHTGHPEDFRTVHTVTENSDGKKLRWPREYMERVKLLVIHHTAIAVTGDTRTGIERMRALYQLHANGRGWGDIGYHYVIDEAGTIYEGRSGGPKVVGGHVYCNNVGTVGISLMGNFDDEEPTKDQIKSLQWLLSSLAEQYGIDLNHPVSFHGRSYQPIVGHRELVSTECPGYYLWGVLDQIRAHVKSGYVEASVEFPPPIKKNYVDQMAERKAKRMEEVKSEPRLLAEGSTDLTGRPGGTVTVHLRFHAGGKPVQRGTRIARITRSHERMSVWEVRGDSPMRLRSEVPLRQFVDAGSSIPIVLQVLLPRESRNVYELRVGDVMFSLHTEGRRMREQQAFAPHPPLPAGRGDGGEGQIRIRLSSQEGAATSCDSINLSSIQSHYRGYVTCQMLNGKPALINTLSLEDYMKGLAEEPDTEPYEKQRAFAIAARTYAAYYLDPSHRKFPGMPYDGSDDPRVFQAYGGKDFEEKSPEWVRAIESTTDLLLMKDNQIIRAPYFSNDDGRTRTPEEAGWSNFPFAEIFSSKPDPWCRGLPLAGHGVGMSGCGARGQANEGKTAEEILRYYYPGTALQKFSDRHR